jgi:hypothetical protein
MIKFALSTFLFCQLLACTAFAEGSAESAILKTYDFEPSKMTYDEQVSQSNNLSKLWGMAEKSRTEYIESLRKLLLQPNQHEILYCDGGMLLLSLSQIKDDTSLGIKSLSRCSMAEIEHTPYFYTMHSLANRGIDTFDLQLKMLEKPKYSVFIVPHVLTLGQSYAFTYPLLVQDEKQYISRLLKRLNIEKDATAQQSLALVIWHAATPESEQALTQFLSNPLIAKETSETIKNVLQSLKDIRATNLDKSFDKDFEYLGINRDSSIETLRQKRRERMRSISDEALEELRFYTALIYQKL